MTRKDNGEEVLFMFRCASCNKRQANWEDGTLWKYEPMCSECRKGVENKQSREGGVITTVYSCTHCGYEEKDEMDLSETKPSKEKEDPNFESDRKKYCLPETDGKEHLTNLKGWKSFMDDLNEKDKNKDLYDAVEKIEKLKVSDLEKRLGNCMKNFHYTGLHFKPPEIERYVTIAFTVQDEKSNREEYDSRKELKKILQTELEKTNWRLMSEGITYRMGVLKGKFKGYEGESQLLELTRRF